MFPMKIFPVVAIPRGSYFPMKIFPMKSISYGSYLS